MSQKIKKKINSGVIFLCIFLIFFSLLQIVFGGVPGLQVDGDTMKLESNKEVKRYAYISGAVKVPGVYEISDREILIDLISKSGGLDGGADISYVEKTINLSKRVRNEDHVFIPYIEIDVLDSSGIESGDNSSNDLININTASSEEIESIKGIGPSTSNKIIEGRPYSKIEDLKEVKGIGDSTFNDLKDLVTIN